MRSFVVSLCAALCLSGCAGNSHRTMDDKIYGLLDSVPVEIIYVEPQPPLMLYAESDPGAAAALFSVFGPLGTAFGAGLDARASYEARRWAEQQLEPYQAAVGRLRLGDALFYNFQTLASRTPALARATLTRFAAEDGATRTPAELALSSRAQEIIVLRPQLVISQFGDQLVAGTEITVYVKPDLGHVVRRDRLLALGSSPLNRKPGDGEPCDPGCLSSWFGDEGKPLQDGLDRALLGMDAQLAAYFHGAAPGR